MQNVKCALAKHTCSKGADACCQFCDLNYAPCSEKCEGCWDEKSLEFGYDVPLIYPHKAVGKIERTELSG